MGLPGAGQALDANEAMRRVEDQFGRGELAWLEPLSLECCLRLFALQDGLDLVAAVSFDLGG
nr:hypothetical protein [Achromobacter ruhlandii]